MNLAVYTRHSADTSTNSEETQTVTATDFAARQAHTITAWFHEGTCSASKPATQRPQASALLLEAMSKHRRFDGILLIRGDRLFRNDIEERATAAELKRYGVVFIALDGSMDRSTLERELASDILARFKQYERQLTGLRIRERNVARVLQGKFPAGYLPLGLYRDPRTGTVAPTDRADDVRTMFQTYLDTGGNACRTLREITARGIRSARGKLLTVYALLVILRSPAYRQRIAYGGRSADVPDLLPRIIPQDITDAVDRLLGESAITAPRAKGSQQAYSGRLVCGSCGSRLHLSSQQHHGKVPGQYLGWQCPHRPAGVCQFRKISQRWLDRLVGLALQQLLAGQDQAAPPASGGSARPTASRRQQLQLQRARWAELYAEGHVDRATYDHKIARLDADLAALDQPAPRRRLTPADLDAWRQLLADGWAAGAQDARRHVLHLLHAEIVVTSPPTGPRAIDLYTTLTDEVIHAEFTSYNRRKKLGESV